MELWKCLLMVMNNSNEWDGDLEYFEYYDGDDACCGVPFLIYNIRFHTLIMLTDLYQPQCIILSLVSRLATQNLKS